MIASPFVFGSSVMALFMMACGIYLDQAMACFFPLAVCAAIDFNLHTVNYFNERITSGCNIADAIRQTLEHKGPVVLMDVFANGLCFSLLIASGFYPIKMLGIVLVIMMFFTGYASLVNSMAMLPWCVKKNETERTKS